MNKGILVVVSGFSGAGCAVCGSSRHCVRTGSNGSKSDFQAVQELMKWQNMRMKLIRSFRLIFVPEISAAYAVLRTRFSGRNS